MKEMMAEIKGIIPIFIATPQLNLPPLYIKSEYSVVTIELK